MLRSKEAFRIQQKHNRQGTIKPTKLNTAKLSTISHRESIEQEMDSALAQWEEKENSTPDEEWAAVQQVVYNTAKTYLGKPEEKTPGLVRPQRPGATDLSTEETKPIRECCKPGTLDPPTTAAYKDACRLLQKRTRAGGEGRQWRCRELLTETI